MGDRANVYMRPRDNDESGVYLYTHWGGYNLPLVVKRALSRKQRWTDESYLTRVIFCEMLREQGQDCLDSELSLGIGCHVCDNEYMIVVVDSANKRIGFAQQPEWGFKPLMVDGAAWSFAEYIELDDNAILRAYSLRA